MAELKYVDWDGLVYYDGKIKAYIADKAEDYLKMGGAITFDKLPDPSYQNLNYIYKITEEFVSNSDFEKPGYKYQAGTWVQVSDINNSAVYRYTIFNEETIGGTADVDLSDYYTKQQVDTKIEEAIESINIPAVELENYYTKEEVDELIPDTDSFVTNDKLEETLEDFATENELNGLKENVADVQEALDEKADKSQLAGLASEEFVLTKISEVSASIPTVDLTPYATKEDLAVVEEKIPSIEHLATKEELEQAIKDIEHPTVDLEGYATEEYVDNKFAEINVPTKVSELENDAGYLTEHQDLSEYAKKTDIPSHDNFATKDDLTLVTDKITAVNKAAAKQRYEVIFVPDLAVTYRDGEIRLNTQHIDLQQQNVGAGGEANAYYIGIKIYAPDNAHSVRQNITSTPGIQADKEIAPFTETDIDAYGRKYSNAWVKCAIYENGSWTNYGLSSTVDKCLGYYYSVEWYDDNGLVIENDSIHVVFTNDSCHFTNISDAVSRKFVDIKSSINNIEQNYVTNKTLENYTTTEQLEATYVTNEKVTEVVTKEVNTVVTNEIETKVTEVIDKKIEDNEITVTTDSITYDTWD